LNAQGTRTGGVIWHTTGSGKSLTMVMLAKALALHPAISNPKVVLVTDRIDLDAQIWRTFHACGKQPVQANSGRHLLELVRSPSADVITTIIDKFETVAAGQVRNDNPNIFVLVDESHRSHYGAIHAMMRRVFPNACYIGFTGTPLLKKEKSTAAKFGSFIHTYPIRRAVEDQAVVPLLYEGRLVELQPNQASIDLWFERVTKELSDEQKKDLKRKFSRQDEISKAEQRIQQIAYDLSEHYAANFQGQGFKAQLAVPTKAIALKYRRFLDDFGIVTSAVVISPPDTREGHESVDEAELPEVQAFWKQMMAQYQTEKRYLSEILASFGRADGIEILIVVDKLLTGFDEPRNTVLYLDKPLKEHGLLQAISRVNRLFEAKPYGYIIDYRGVLGELNETLNVYDALAGFDPGDVAGTITGVDEVIRSLPPLHSAVWAIFAPVPNKQDTEQMERFLEPENLREQFYEALRAFTRAFQVALSTVAFYETVPEPQIDRYKRDLTFFINLRNSVRLRYAERIEYAIYDKQIRKLMDRHIEATEVREITPQVNIFDVDAFAAEVEKVEGSAARADTIAYRMKRTISERMEQDPAFYKKFSELIEETIDAYRQGRIDEAEYYRQMQAHYHHFAGGRASSLPPQLRPYKHAPAYFGILQDYFGSQSLVRLGGDEWSADNLSAEALAADAAIRIEQIIEAKKIRDWVHNVDVQNQMKNEIEDYLFMLKGRHDLSLSYDELDLILEQLIHTARQRNNL
jgi:type I restriction enzyme R subunit